MSLTELRQKLFGPLIYASLKKIRKITFFSDFSFPSLLVDFHPESLRELSIKNYLINKKAIGIAPQQNIG